MPVLNLSETKRQKILEEATTLFLEEGYSAASMSELLRRVGGSKTTIYSHFGDKAGLFTAIVDELLTETVAFADAVNLSALTVRAALCKIALQHLDLVLSDRYVRMIRIVAAEVERFPEIGKAFYDHGPGLSYANFKVFLDERVAAGELVIDDTSHATDLFFGTLLHREVLARIYGVKKAPLRNRKAVADAVTNEFLKRYGCQV
jgi:AcrR family transcriptional regulator